MTENITACVTNKNVPLTSPATLPTIRIRRLDTQALVVTDDNMTEVGDGCYVYVFTESALLEYSIQVDADPAAALQVTPEERYHFGFMGVAPGAALIRKILLNKSVTTENLGPAPPAGSKTVDFYDDDQTTIIESIEISADGLTRTMT